jgi:hypothetical protein
VDRRRFLVTSLAGALAAPLITEAQRPERLYRIGMLERTSPEINAANLAKALGATIPPAVLARPMG